MDNLDKWEGNHWGLILDLLDTPPLQPIQHPRIIELLVFWLSLIDPQSHGFNRDPQVIRSIKLVLLLLIKASKSNSLICSYFVNRNVHLKIMTFISSGFHINLCYQLLIHIVTVQLKSNLFVMFEQLKLIHNVNKNAINSTSPAIINSSLLLFLNIMQINDQR